MVLFNDSKQKGKTKGQKKKIERGTKQISTTKRKKPSVTMEEEIDEDKCEHDHHNLGMSFNPEINVEYWKQGASMFGVLCKSCNGNFYGKKKYAKYHIKHQLWHAKDVKSMDAPIVYVTFVLQLS